MSDNPNHRSEPSTQVTAMSALGNEPCHHSAGLMHLDPMRFDAFDWKGSQIKKGNNLWMVHNPEKRAVGITVEVSSISAYL